MISKLIITLKGLMATLKESFVASLLLILLDWAFRVLLGFGLFVQDIYGQEVLNYAMIICLIFDATIGGMVHWKDKDFDFKQLIKGTMFKGFSALLWVGMYRTMMTLDGWKEAGVVVTVVLLTFNLSTLLYLLWSPFVNLHYLTGGKMPPKWVMRRTKKFKESGNLKDLTDESSNNSRT